MVSWIASRYACLREKCRWRGSCSGSSLPCLVIQCGVSASVLAVSKIPHHGQVVFGRGLWRDPRDRLPRGGGSLHRNRRFLFCTSQSL